MPRDLLEGLGRFRREYYPKHEGLFRDLVRDGQAPRVLFIGCSDSRVIPERLTSARPGELFVVRNAGNLVPPFEPESGYHGVSAAIEYAVEILGVRDIVVCGHSHCGAVRALYDEIDPSLPNLRHWLELAAPARLPGTLDEDLLRRTEQRSIVLSLDRLMTFPGVRRRVEEGTVGLHGWHYLLEEGRVLVLDPIHGSFVPVEKTG